MTSIINKIGRKLYYTVPNFTIGRKLHHMDLRRAEVGSFGAIGFGNCW